MPLNADAKGKTYERDVAKYLGEHYERMNAPGWIGEDGRLFMSDGRVISIECKNQKKMALSAWVDQALDQAVVRDLPAAVIHKRVGRAEVGDHYVTLTVDDFLRVCGLT